MSVSEKPEDEDHKPTKPKQPIQPTKPNQPNQRNQTNPTKPTQPNQTKPSTHQVSPNRQKILGKKYFFENFKNLAKSKMWDLAKFSKSSNFFFTSVENFLLRKKKVSS